MRNKITIPEIAGRVPNSVPSTELVLEYLSQGIKEWIARDIHVYLLQTKDPLKYNARAEFHFKDQVSPLSEMKTIEFEEFDKMLPKLNMMCTEMAREIVRQLTSENPSK